MTRDTQKESFVELNYPSETSSPSISPLLSSSTENSTLDSSGSSSHEYLDLSEEQQAIDAESGQQVDDAGINQKADDAGISKQVNDIETIKQSNNVETSKQANAIETIKQSNDVESDRPQTDAKTSNHENGGKTSQPATKSDQPATKGSNQRKDELTAKDKPIRQANEVICELSWSARDAIILHLNRHSALLVGKTISSQAKKEMMKKNMHLLSVLMNLPMKGGDQTERQILVDQTSFDVEEDGGSNKLILEIGWTEKTRLINGLLENHHHAILYNHSASEASKLELVKQNQKLLHMLMNLPFRAETLNPLECSKREETADPDTRFHVNLDDHQVARECLHVNAAEKIFVVKFDQIGEFLASNDRAMEKRSKLLRCDDIIWYLKLSKIGHESIAAESTESDLSVKLIAVVGSDIASIEVYFSIKLYDQSAGRYEVIEKSATHTFTPKKFWWGWSRFIPISQLNELEFIKDDSITMQLHLKVLNVERVEY